MLLYLTGADYISKHLKYQDELVRDSTGSDEEKLPIETDPKTAIRVYADRLRMVVEFPVVLFSRVTGIDAAIRKIRQK